MLEAKVLARVGGGSTIRGIVDTARAADVSIGVEVSGRGMEPIS